MGFGEDSIGIHYMMNNIVSYSINDTEIKLYVVYWDKIITFEKIN